MRGRILRALGLAIALVGAAPAGAVTIAVQAARDTTLYDDGTGTVSNGAGEGMFAGTTAGGSLRRALVAFDLSAIPVGATIQSVVLTLHVTRTNAGSLPVELHRLAASWGEGASNAGSQRDGNGTVAAPGDATWLHRFYTGTQWSSPGGDFASGASGAPLVGGIGAYTWSGAGLVADVQAWLAEPASNFGWLLRGVESEGGTAKRFATRQHITPELQPLLEVAYTVAVPEPGLAALLLLPALLLARRGETGRR